MSSKDILIQARNRALAADRSTEQRVLLGMFQEALDMWMFLDDEDFIMILDTASEYVQSPQAGEG